MRPCLGAHRPAVGGPSQQVAAKAKAPVRLPRAQPVPLQVPAVTQVSLSEAVSSSVHSLPNSDQGKWEAPCARQKPKQVQVTSRKP